MALEVIGPGNVSVTIDGDDERLLTLPRQFGIASPRSNYIWERFYQNPQIATADGVREWLAELCELRAAYRRSRAEELARERGVRTKDPVTRERILDRLLEGDQLTLKIDELVALCDLAVGEEHGLLFRSD